MNEQIIPVGSRSIIKPYEAASQTKSGLVMDNSSNVSSAPVRGTIIKAGDKSIFKDGDDIFFRRYSLDLLKFITDQGEQEVALVEDEDILAKVIKNEKS